MKDADRSINRAVGVYFHYRRNRGLVDNSTGNKDVSSYRFHLHTAQSRRLAHQFAPDAANRNDRFFTADNLWTNKDARFVDIFQVEQVSEQFPPFDQERSSCRVPLRSPQRMRRCSCSGPTTRTSAPFDSRILLPCGVSGPKTKMSGTSRAVSASSENRQTSARVNNDTRSVRFGSVNR